MDRLSTGLNILWQFDDNQPHGYAVGAFLMEMDMTFKERDRWMRAVLADDRLTLAQRAVACRIALFLRVETGELPFKWECLQQALQCSTDVIAQALKKLEDLGHLIVHRNGRYSPNVYALSTPSGGVRETESIDSVRQSPADSARQSEVKKSEVKKEESTSYIPVRTAPGVNLAPEDPG